MRKKSLLSEAVFKALLISPFFWLSIFFFVPLGFLGAYSFSEVENIIGLKLTWTFGNYLKIAEPVYAKVFFKTFWIAALTTKICLFTGFWLALFIASRSSQKMQYALLFLIILPFWTNLLVRTYSLIAVLRTNGFLNDALGFFWNALHRAAEFAFSGQSLLGPYRKLELLYNDFAVVFGLVYVHLPFAVLPIYAALAKMNPSLVEASMDLGAGRWRTLRGVVIPNAAEGIFAAALITFIPVLGSFLTPNLLGGNNSQMIANLIERQFKSANNWPFGSALSALLVYVLFAAVAFKPLFRRK